MHRQSIRKRQFISRSTALISKIKLCRIYSFVNNVKVQVIISCSDLYMFVIGEICLIYGSRNIRTEQRSKVRPMSHHDVTCLKFSSNVATKYELHTHYSF